MSGREASSDSGNWSSDSSDKSISDSGSVWLSLADPIYRGIIDLNSYAQSPCSELLGVKQTKYQVTFS